MFYIDGSQEDTMAVSIASNASTVTRTVSMDCYSGHTFSAVSGPSPGATIEFQHSTDGGWTDIENEAYDLSSFASLSQPVEFSIRVNPEAVSLEEVRTRKGPAETGITGRVTFNSVGVYFLGEPVTFTPGAVYFNNEVCTFNGETLTFNP